MPFWVAKRKLSPREQDKDKIRFGSYGLLLFNFLFYFICVHACMFIQVHVGRSEGNFLKLVLIFHLVRWVSCFYSGLQPHWPANFQLLLSPQAPPLISLQECWPYRCKRLFSVGSSLQTVMVSALNHGAFYPIPFICILKISPVIQETVVIIKRVVSLYWLILCFVSLCPLKTEIFILDLLELKEIKYSFFIISFVHFKEIVERVQNKQTIASILQEFEICSKTTREV